MSFKSMREARLLSQEKVAEVSGLSLRTVQRLEAGHRVSYASLRSLAAAFEMDVDLLERELYAAKSSTDDFVEVPRWVRTLNAWPFDGPRLSRREVRLVEIFCVLAALLVFAASFLVSSEVRASVVRTGAGIALLAAYSASLFARMLDAHNLWPAAGAA